VGSFSFLVKVSRLKSSRAAGKNKRLGLVNAGVLFAGSPKVSVIASRFSLCRGFSLARCRVHFLGR
jgi:hypothetical protein